MEAKIDYEISKLTNNDPAQNDPAQIQNILNLINIYEQDLYDKDLFSKTEQSKIKKWRNALFNITTDSVPEVLESTVKIINRQINKMDSNTSLLSRGTLKLMGLNYTNEDIDAALLKTKNKLGEKKRTEMREIRLVYFSFFVLIGVCLYVLVDKYYL
ncbi:hypothetical protein NGRA_1280 [Nosema granulosis]|uniref:Uncharacterized protein n=1 Tax=Nosema granulosis TaxID=83296 RepID=A0A9P6KZQ3_9MICR|nr:hypothetical protein NGRA_1280 [Nosema granulosis]